MTLPLDPQLSYGLTEQNLKLESNTMLRAADLTLGETLAEVTDYGFVRHDPDTLERTMNMALALFLKLTTDADNAFDGLGYNDIFSACIDTAMIWEVG